MTIEDVVYPVGACGFAIILGLLLVLSIQLIIINDRASEIAGWVIGIIFVVLCIVMPIWAGILWLT